MLAYRLCYSCGSAQRRSSITAQLWYRPLAPASMFLQLSSLLVSLIFSGWFSGLTPHRLSCSVFPDPLYAVDGSRVQLLNGDKKCDLRCFHPTFYCVWVQHEVERTSQSSFTQRCCPVMWFQWLNQSPQKRGFIILSFPLKHWSPL